MRASDKAILSTLARDDFLVQYPAMPKFLRLLFLLPLSLWAASTTEVSPQEAQAGFTTSRVLVTGTVEGFTEFLPISSTGHMIISDRLMKVPDDENVIVKGVVDHKGRPVTMERVADDYLVIIQVGAIAAVLLVFWSRIWNILRGLCAGSPAAWRLAGALFIAFFPAAFLGLLFKEKISELLFSPEVVGIALIAGGLVIFIAEEKLPGPPASGDEVSKISYRQAFIVGICQCCALIPGTSRSLSTILGGRLAGLSNAAATEFSFLVGLIILTGASVYKMWSLGPALAKVYPVGPAALGLLVAGITALIAVRWMVGFVSQRGLKAFAWYRIAVGAAILVYFNF
jgi:undecaprenyl-diphosphatase